VENRKTNVAQSRIGFNKIDIQLLTHLGFKAHFGLKMLRSTKIISASSEHFFVSLTVFVVFEKN